MLQCGGRMEVKMKKIFPYIISIVAAIMVNVIITIFFKVEVNVLVLIIIDILVCVLMGEILRKLKKFRS